jgi:hypothetical protein
VLKAEFASNVLRQLGVALPEIGRDRLLIFAQFLADVLESGQRFDAANPGPLGDGLLEVRGDKCLDYDSV